MGPKSLDPVQRLGLGHQGVVHLLPCRSHLVALVVDHLVVVESGRALKVVVTGGRVKKALGLQGLSGQHILGVVL